MCGRTVSLFSICSRNYSGFTVGCSDTTEQLVYYLQRIFESSNPTRWSSSDGALEQQLFGLWGLSVAVGTKARTVNLRH